MNTSKIIGILIFSMISVMAINFKASAKTETQKYETILREGNFEIRHYPPALLASVEMEGSYDVMKNQGFRVLAGYIFGNNQKNQKISMTSPVRFSEEDGNSVMSFVMPSSMDMENLPEPGDKRIELHRSEPVYVAALRFGGYSSDEKIAARKEELKDILKAKGIDHSAEFEYLGYNPPFQIFNRRNEVVVHLQNFDPSQQTVAGK